MSKQAAQNTTNQITEGVIWKQLLIFFFPILFGTFFQQLYNTADAIIVGNFVGKEALASVGGSASTIINLLVGFFVGLSSGATVIISQYYGADNRRRVSDSVHTAIALAIAGGIVIMLLGLVSARFALTAMGTPDDILSLSLTYMKIYYLGTIPSMIYNMGSGILRAVGDPKRPLYFLIASCLVNIVLDLLFVAVLDMGVAGAAIATIASQFFSAILTLIALLRTQDSYRCTRTGGSLSGGRPCHDWRFPRGESEETGTHRSGKVAHPSAHAFGNRGSGPLCGCVAPV